MPAFDLKHWLAHRLAVFAGVALLELGCILRAAAPLEDAEPMPLQAAHPALLSRHTDQDAPKLPQAHLDAMLARPLFTPGRAPRRPEQPSPAAPPTPPRLAGLVIAGGERRAIFASPDGRRPIVVREGTQLGPFNVTAIHPAEVELTGPSGVRRLRPSSDAGLRSQFASKVAVVALIDPVRRELETESNQ